MRNDIVKQKVKNTWLEKYNVSHISQRHLSKQELSEKMQLPECAINTFIRYNKLKKSPKQISEIKRRTMMKNYGVTNVWQLEEVKSKIKKTN